MCGYIGLYVILSIYLLNLQHCTSSPIDTGTLNVAANPPGFEIEVRGGHTPIDRLSAYIAIIRALTYFAWQDWEASGESKVFDFREVRLIAETSPPGKAEPVSYKYAVMALFQAAAIIRESDPMKSTRFIAKHDWLPQMELWFLRSTAMNDFSATSNYTQDSPVRLAQLQTYNGSDLSPSSAIISNSSSSYAENMAFARTSRSFKRSPPDSDAPPDFTGIEYLTTNSTKSSGLEFSNVATNLTMPSSLGVPNVNINVTFLDDRALSMPNFYYALAGAMKAMAPYPRSDLAPPITVAPTDCPVHVKISPGAAQRLTAAMVIRLLVKATEESLRLQRWNRFRARVYDMSTGAQGVEIGKVEIIRSARRPPSGRPVSPGWIQGEYESLSS